MWSHKCIKHITHLQICMLQNLISWHILGSQNNPFLDAITSLDWGYESKGLRGALKEKNGIF